MKPAIPADSRVLLEDGTSVPVGELRVGMRLKDNGGGYLVPAHLREAVLGMKPFERSLPLALDVASVAPVPVKAAPVVDCFCGKWRFAGISDKPRSSPREYDGTVHTPDACGRFEPASPESLRVNFGTMKITAGLIEKFVASPSFLAVRYTAGEREFHTDIVTIPDPERMPAPVTERRVCDNCKRAAKAKDGRTDRGIPIGPCYCDVLNREER